MGTVTKVVKVIRGEDKTINLRLRDENGDPFDITGADVNPNYIKVIFKKEDGTLLTKETGGLGVAIVNAVAGKFTVDLEDADTSLLKAADFQDFEVEIKISDDITIVKFEKSITVKKRLA